MRVVNGIKTKRNNLVQNNNNDKQLNELYFRIFYFQLKSTEHFYRFALRRRRLGPLSSSPKVEHTRRNNYIIFH